MKSKRGTLVDEETGADAVAIGVLGRLVTGDERLERFLAVTGLRPDSLRAAASAPGFLPAVLDHVLGDETLLLAIAGELNLKPEAIAAAHARLAGPPPFD